MSIILAYQSFPPPGTQVEDDFLSNLQPEILSALLTAASNLFSSPHDFVRSCSATLFSRIACLDILKYDKLSIIPILINALKTPASEVALHSICLVLTDVFEVARINDNELFEILNIIFTYLSSPTLPDELKNACISVLRPVIDNMSEVLSDEGNLNQLFGALFALSQNPGTKASAFKCWTQFALIYYPMLKPIVDQLVTGSFTELVNLSNDRDTILSICEFWKTIAECELDKSAELNIIPRAAGTLIPILFRISTMVSNDECDSIEAYEPHIAASQALQSITSSSPAISMPILTQLIVQFNSSENFNEREASLNLLNYIIQFCDSTPMIMESLQLIGQRLGDNSPRVRQAAIYCVHAILNSILIKKDKCPFASLIPQIGKVIVQFSLVIINLMNDQTEVSATASLTIADFIQFPRFPYVGVALGQLLKATLRTNLYISQSAFSAMQNAIGNTPIPILRQLLKSILDIILNILTNNPNAWIIIQFVYILQSILIRLVGQMDEFIESCWNILNAIFQAFPDEAPNLLAPLAALGRASGEKFIQFVPHACEFLLKGLQTVDREDAIARAAFGISLFSDRFDMTPFAAAFLEHLTNAMANPNITIETKRFVAEAIGDLAKSAPSVSIGLVESVMPPILEICQHMNDIFDMIPEEDEEDYDIENILISFINCLQKTLEMLIKAQSQLAIPITIALLDLLEVVGGLTEHSDKMLTCSVLTMFFLAQNFPDQMNEYFQDEPGYEVLLREAREAGILPEVVAVLSQFFQI
ncbi:Kap95p [Histomonas meleagridis]|uniref:Kap95p n=1 Tax=Histomonas meleagridis TaxID=135588 RepID=UPI00355943AA|nr:Kap95p [Histomonas meleagridis]KAH0803578.1 Kap95p [Histomonas meleagridis]